MVTLPVGSTTLPSVLLVVASAVVAPTENNSDGLPILIENKFLESGGYSGNVYDMKSATQDGIIYPSLDPSIFELKYPNIDIEGRVIGDSAGGS